MKKRGIYILFAVSLFLLSGCDDRTKQKLDKCKYDFEKYKENTEERIVHEINARYESLVSLNSTLSEKVSFLEEQEIDRIKSMNEIIGIARQFIKSSRTKSEEISHKRYCDTLGQFAIFCDKAIYKNAEAHEKDGFTISDNLRTFELYLMTFMSFLLPVLALFSLFYWRFFMGSLLKYENKKQLIESQISELHLEEIEVRNETTNLQNEMDIYSEQIEEMEEYEIVLKEENKKLQDKIKGLKEEIIKLENEKKAQSAMTEIVI